MLEKSNDADTVVVELSEGELAVLLCEAACGLVRPPGMTALQAIETMDAEDRAVWLRAARAAIEYFGRTMTAAHPGASMFHLAGDGTRQ